MCHRGAATRRGVRQVAEELRLYGVHGCTFCAGGLQRGGAFALLEDIVTVPTQQDKCDAREGRALMVISVNATNLWHVIVNFPWTRDSR